jgi:hypothetical protein
MHDMRRRVFPHLALLACVLLFACARSDPERELRAAVAQMAHAVEARTPGDLLEYLADDFTRESSTFGKPDVRRMLAGVILRNEKISVTAIVTSVEITGERARMKVRVVATGGAALFPERGQTWDFDAAWRREKGRWRVFNAEWQEGL